MPVRCALRKFRKDRRARVTRRPDISQKADAPSMTAKSSLFGKLRIAATGLVVDEVISLVRSLAERAVSMEGLAVCQWRRVGRSLIEASN